MDPVIHSVVRSVARLQYHTPRVEKSQAEKKAKQKNNIKILCLNAKRKQRHGMDRVLSEEKSSPQLKITAENTL
jgi:hypothetical protein